MTRYSRYEEVSRLDDTQQQELLAEGDPPERVWAAWALGLKRGADVVPDLAKTLAVEPSAGARRHLAIVLGGFGERWLLTVLATGDPDAGVRETACRHLARIAGDAASRRGGVARDEASRDGDEIHELLLERLLRDEAGVRAAILRCLPADAPESLRRLAETALTDPALEVREAAFLRVVARVEAGEALPAIVFARALEEPDRFLRKRLARLVSRGLSDVPRLALLKLLLVMQVQPPDPEAELETFEESLLEHVKHDLLGLDGAVLTGEELDVAVRLRAVLEIRNTDWAPGDADTPPLPIPVEPRLPLAPTSASEAGGLWDLLAVLRRVT